MKPAIKTKFAFLIPFLIQFPLSFYSQNPGGVSTGLTSWFKTDNAASLTGNPVSSWASSGGSSGISLTQATATQRPNLTTASSVYKQWSYLGPLSFSTSNLSFLSNTTYTGNLVGATGAIFLISDMEATGVTACTYRNSTNRYQFKTSFRIQTSNTGTTGYTFDFGLPPNISSTSACEITCFGAGSNQSIALNSVRTTTCANCNLGLYTPAVANGFFLGANPSNAEYSNNEIAEAITYNTALSVTDVNKIETYLSIKYGITRGGNANTGAAYNYISSNGTTVFDKSLNAGYTNDIAGIGRDDASGLNKKQSISVNNNEPVTIGLGTIASDNASNSNTFANDQSFLIWGNNGLPCTSNFSTTTIGLPATVQARIQRIWKVQATNFGGIGGSNTYVKTAASPLVKVGFETSLLTAYSPVSNLRLLVDDDGTNWSNATIVNGAVLNGSRIEFPNVQFSTTQKYFTLATVNYSATPLPVDLIQFTAECRDGKIELFWKTAMEANNHYFTIEKSEDAKNWFVLDTVPANITSSIINNYNYTDKNPLAAIGYYRLKQTDKSKMFKYYNLLCATEGCGNSGNKIIIYPNPSDGILVVKGRNLERVEIYNVIGDFLINEPINLSSELQEIKSVSGLPDGTYLIKIYQNKNEITNIKWIKGMK